MILLVSFSASQWDAAFQSQDISPSTLNAEQAVRKQEEVTGVHSDPRQVDELARTAGRLMETVQHEENPKFKNSEFLGLMRQLRDGDVVVDGDKMVARESASSLGSTQSARGSEFQGSVDAKGKGRALDMPITAYPGSSASIAQQSLHAPPTFQARDDHRSLADTTAAVQNYDESPIDAYLREENEQYIEYQRAMQPIRSNVRESYMDMYAQDADWGRLQRDWDVFEATATGIRPLAHYQFQAHNPYLLGEASRTRHHSTHSGQKDSLFEVCRPLTFMG